MAPAGGSRGRERRRDRDRSTRSPSPEERKRGSSIRPPPVVGQFTVRTSARQDRAKRLPHWECLNPKCRCDFNWATRLVCHRCEEPRPRAPKGPKPPPAVPSVRTRRQATPPQAPNPRTRRQASPAPAARVRRQPSPVPAASPLPAQASQAAPAAQGAFKEAETRVKALRKDVAHLEAQAEQDPCYYEPLLRKAQSDLTAASEAMHRAKPVGSQLQSCLSRKAQLEKTVENFGSELADLEEQVLAKREEFDQASAQLDAQEVELKRLTLLHHDPTTAQPGPCPAATAIMALLTPEFSASLLVSLELLQYQMAKDGAGAPASSGAKASVPPTPAGGTATPRPGQNPASPRPGGGTATPRPEATGSSTPKARSRSPAARADTAETGSRPGAFTIPGLATLQQVLGLAAGRRPDLIPVEDEDMSSEL